MDCISIRNWNNLIFKPQTNISPDSCCKREKTELDFHKVEKKKTSGYGVGV